jgi:hypothetical protein
MKRRSEHLVEKRDGRSEFLRATKLARSVHCALHSVGIDEDWRAIEIANVALQALRRKHCEAEAEEPVLLTTSELSDAVQHLLVVTGQPSAAVAYGAVAAERTRRRRSVAEYGRMLALGASAKAEVGDDQWRHRRVGLE